MFLLELSTHVQCTRLFMLVTLITGIFKLQLNCMISSFSTTQHQKQNYSMLCLLMQNYMTDPLIKPPQLPLAAILIGYCPSPPLSNTALLHHYLVPTPWHILELQMHLPVSLHCSLYFPLIWTFYFPSWFIALTITCSTCLVCDFAVMDFPLHLQYIHSPFT